MAIRTPRYKHEFLSLQNVSITERVNILLTTNQFSVVEKAIRSHIDNNKHPTKYTFGLLSFNNIFYNLEDLPTLIFEHESRDISETFPYQKRIFDLKYLTQEFEIKREEDFYFFAKILSSGIASNPQFQSLSDRNGNRKTGSLNPRVVTEIIRNYTMDIGERRPLTELDHQRFRELAALLVQNKISQDYNIYVGGDYITQASLENYSPEYLYHFLYLYLYRLYDITINRGMQVNICIVLEGLSALLDPSTFDSFYVTKEESLERHRKIMILLKTLLSQGTKYKLNFIILDNNPEMIKFAEPYCKLVDSEISGISFDFKESIDL